MIIDPSVIVFEGLTAILSSIEGDCQIVKVDCLKEASENIKSETFQLVIVNSMYFHNGKNARIKIATLFHNVCVIGLIHASMERNICDSFIDCIYINDDKKTIHSLIKKHLQNSDTKSEINNDVLSDREIDVLKLLVHGYANKEIAEELFISTHTVISHRKNISKKIGIKSTAAMAIYAAANNIIDVETVLKNLK